jgi:hypothetical protein
VRAAASCRFGVDALFFADLSVRAFDAPSVGAAPETQWPGWSRLWRGHATSAPFSTTTAAFSRAAQPVFVRLCFFEIWEFSGGIPSGVAPFKGSVLARLRSLQLQACADNLKKASHDLFPITAALVKQQQHQHQQQQQPRASLSPEQVWQLLRWYSHLRTSLLCDCCEPQVTLLFRSHFAHGLLMSVACSSTTRGRRPPSRSVAAIWRS